ncbi:cupredoxin family copper-binding protein [Candidatus Woesearchaeota archaeon]|nr:cupredoxin family copper-binding protein [Candidatus Woesearchaeota archaeon]
MKISRLIIAILSMLMIFAVACGQQPVTPGPPEPLETVPSTPVQPAAPAPQAPAPTQTTPAAPEQTAKTVQVSIKSFKFTPADVAVNVGDIVVWTNEDSAPHTVESSDGTLRSDELSKGDSFSFKFTKAGKYNYICGIHPGMKGSVTVQ